MPVPWRLSPEIEEREDEDPDEVDEVPVEAHDLHRFILPFAACEEAAPFVIVVPAPDLAGDDKQEEHAEAHMGAVKARDHEEGRAELCRSPWVGPGAHALMDQL